MTRIMSSLFNFVSVFLYTDVTGDVEFTAALALSPSQRLLVVKLNLPGGGRFLDIEGY